MSSRREREVLSEKRELMRRGRGERKEREEIKRRYCGRRGKYTKGHLHILPHHQPIEIRTFSL